MIQALGDYIETAQRTAELGVPDETLQKGPAQLEPKRTVV
jgi:hypothetical protein